MSDAPPAFQELYQAELAYVVRTLQRLGVASADLEDAAQDVFVTAYRRRADRDADRPVRPWLFGIAFRVVGNYRQKAHRRREIATDEVVAAAAGPSPEDDASTRQRRELLMRALDRLDLDHRAVAVLFEIEGLAAPAIAEILGIPINTVYSRARAARHKLLDATREMRGGKR
ncbi:MAG: sigma-70 family RNA polymerase sigma factor [Myxococcales bacterium]|nr:sigma-70 family RNA polymerase sigma factor [Myxococcales bacterium]